MAAETLTPAAPARVSIAGALATLAAGAHLVSALVFALVMLETMRAQSDLREVMRAAAMSICGDPTAGRPIPVFPVD